MAREPRDMKPWTFYVPSRIKKMVSEELAPQATKAAGRRIRPSAVARALVTLATADPELVRQAVAAAAAEPPSGPPRSGLANDTSPE